ncbi:hypothetical protein [Caldiplasma sukawensis]
MGKVVINGYLLRIKEKNKSGYKPLRNFDGNSSDFAKILYDFINGNQGFNNIKDLGDQKTIYYGDLGYYDQQQEIIKGKSYVGAYGNDYEVVDRITKQVDYNIKPDDSYGFPLNFMIHIPSLNSNTKLSETGIVVFEKFKNHGAKSLFEVDLKQYFYSSSQHNSYLIEIEPFIPKEIINTMEHGKISSTTIKGSSISSDMAENISMEKNSKVELTFKNASITAKLRNSIVNILRNGGHFKLGEVLEGPIIDPNEISFDTEYNGQKRRVILKEEGEMMTPGIDVTEDVKPFTNRGYPNDIKMYEREYEYIQQIKQSYNSRV